MDPNDIREFDRLRKRRERAEARDLTIPRCANPRRRKRCEQDIFLALRTYFPERFDGAWTPNRREMIEDIMRVATFGGDQATAGERALGKTTIVKFVLLLLMLWGRVRFGFIVSKNGPEARSIVEDIKDELETNDLLLADYPEVCVPIRALEGAPQRSSHQTVGGERTRIRWKEDHFILPMVKGSRAAGAVLVARGIDGSFRGINRRNRRPDLVLIDDPDSEESAESALETAKRIRTIDRAIGGLARGGARIARVLLCTCMNRRCVAYTYTDREQRPAWHGKRFRMLVKPPEREDLWEQYIVLLQQGQQAGNDSTGKAATEFYLAHRDEMDAGAEVSDPDRYLHDLDADGRPLEHSALQHIYNLIARNGVEAFLTECQNDPPEEEMPETGGLSSALVQSRLSRTDKGIVPDNTVALTAFVDVGRYALHWIVTAWKEGAIGTVIDYGVEDVHSPAMMRDAGRRGGERETGVEHAIMQALRSLRQYWLTEPYCGLDGIARSITPIGVDYGYYPDAVMAFVREVGGDPWRACKGHGSAKGLSGFRLVKKATAEIPRRFIGDNWYATREPDRQVLYHVHTDHWKRWVHDRLATQPHEPGSLMLYGSEARVHMTISKHLTAEHEETKFVPGKGVETKWVQTNKNNHWLDGACGCAVMASMAGVKLLPVGPAKTAARTTGRFTPQERRVASPWSVYRTRKAV